MATLDSFEDLQVWKDAREFAKEVYQLTRAGGLAKDFRLRDQMNDACCSIKSNIAEGFERGSTREYIQFLYISKGSSGEIRSQFYTAFDRGHISEEVLRTMTNKAKALSRQLAGFIAYLSRSNFKRKQKPPPSSK
jgi:four helix bundle protein